MSGILFSKLSESWSNVLPRGAVVMARRRDVTQETSESISDAPAEVSAGERLCVFVAAEFRESPFLQKMLGSIGVAAHEFECVDFARLDEMLLRNAPILVFSHPSVSISAQERVFVLPAIEQIQKDALAKRHAWEELKKLAKQLGKPLSPR